MKRGSDAFELDSVAHQQFRRLAAWSAAAPDIVLRAVDFIDYNRLEITTDRATYILDLFSLDEDWQQLVYLENYYHPEDTPGIIDLRLKRPTVAPAAD